PRGNGPGFVHCRSMRGLVVVNNFNATAAVGQDLGADGPPRCPVCGSQLSVHSPQSSALGPTLQVGDLLYYKRTRTGERGGQTMTLTACEAFVLEFLIHNKGKICSRTEILAGALGYLSDPGTNVVDQTVKRIRDKVEDRSKPKLIHSVYGKG